MNDFAYASATKLTKSIQDKRISSVELLELYIVRYERLNPRINAIVATDFENARIRARAADKKLLKKVRARGRPCLSGPARHQLPGRWKCHVYGPGPLEPGPGRLEYYDPDLLRPEPPDPGWRAPQGRG